LKNFCELCAFSRNGLDAGIGYTSGEFRGKDGWLKGPVEAGISKGRSAFPNDDSVYRLIYLGLEQISRKWTMPIKNWKAAATTVCDPLRSSLTVRSALASLKLDRDEFRLHKNSDTLE
jgi:hypothetical protein